MFVFKNKDIDNYEQRPMKKKGLKLINKMKEILSKAIDFKKVIQ